MINNILQVHGIGGNGLKASDKQSLIDICNTAEANSEAIRTNVISKLNAMGAGLAGNASWATIQAKIASPTALDPDTVAGNIRTGANILGVAGSSKRVQVGTLVRTGGTKSAAQVENFAVNSLTFLPAKIMLFKTTAGAGEGISWSGDGSITSNQAGSYCTLEINTVTATGFNLKVTWQAVTVGTDTFTWFVSD